MATPWTAMLPMLFVLGAKRAEACSCVMPAPSHRTLPVDGARDFPTDGVLRVLLDGPWPVEDRKRLAEEVRLIGPQGPVPLTASVKGRLLELRPERLQPDTTYVIERLYAYEDGTLLSDAARWRAAGWPSGQADTDADIVRRWYPEGTFITAAQDVERQPAAPQVVEAFWSTRRGGGDCGPGESVWAELTLPDDLGPNDLVALDLARQGRVWVAAPLRLPGGGHSVGMRIQAGDMACMPEPVHLQLKARPKLRVTVLTPGGEGEPGPWTTVEPYKEEPSATPKHHGERSERVVERDLTAMGAWFSPAIALDPARAAPGPAACPHGLETAPAIAASTGNWPSHPPAPGLWQSSGGWVLPTLKDDVLGVLSVGVEERWKALGEEPEKARYQVLPGGEDAVVVRWSERGLRVAAPDWSWQVRGEGRPAEVQAVVAEGLLFVAWVQHHDTLRSRESVALVALDLQTGIEVMHQAGLPGTAGGKPSGLAWDGEHLWLTTGLGRWDHWGPWDEGRDRTVVFAIDAQGHPVAEHTLPVVAGWEVQLAPTDHGVVAAWPARDARGSTRPTVAWLDTTGIRAPPQALGHGTSGTPRGLVWRDGLAALVWTEPNSGNTWAAAFDETGASTAAVRLGEGYAREPVISLTNDGTWMTAMGVSGGRDRGFAPTLQGMRCATSAAPGPPARLE